MKAIPIYHRFTHLLIVLLCFSSAAISQDLRNNLFAKVDDALKAANTAKASVLAPDNYQKAANLYKSAEKKLKRKKSIESINKDLNSAAKYFTASIKAAKIGAVTLETPLQARNDAEAAEAEKYAPQEWKDAEKKMYLAASKLEKGNVKKAQSKGDEARTRYRAAELAAIKNNYLFETRRLIASAKKQKVHKYAPKTLENAKNLLAQAEKQLTENRYDTDEARSSARTAKSQANHSIYLKNVINRVDNDEETMEEFALKSEQPLLSIAESLDMIIELDGGPEIPTKLIVDAINSLRKDSIELIDTRGEVLGLEEKVRKLEQKLGVQTSSINRQKEVKRTFARVESMFSPQEAQVYRQSGNLLVRMVGLNFKTSQSTIQSQYFSLLREVITAIRLFPNASLVVEGHTDSFGSDIENQTLSKARADAVIEYLKANMPEINTDMINAVGYGESHPVANNETREGRKKNRRIDLLIKPKR